QAKQLFARYGLPAPVGYACTTPREAEEAASKIGAGPWVVKCQPAVEVPIRRSRRVNSDSQSSPSRIACARTLRHKRFVVKGATR
ncbi:hypothetical protein MJN51_35885, partial [Salmonella enterica subsp. enterica serovar Kentucky]|nr:hypothetical protein [Salmonella enterica subsp. enterica serovar Kentucky]